MEDTSTERKFKDLGPLHELLIKACPPNEQGIRSINILAEALDMTPQGVARWYRKGRIPPIKAAQVVDVSMGRVTLADFSPFVFL